MKLAINEIPKFILSGIIKRYKSGPKKKSGSTDFFFRENLILS